MDQDLPLSGLEFILPFAAPDADLGSTPSCRFARSIGLPLRFYRCGRDYMEIVRNPPHGHGKNVNPCIDCKIYFLRKAAEIMREEKAAFVATGEVVGQRPMSQMRHMLRHIEKESGLEGYLLRPLSAKLLKPTRAEEEGIVDRERLCAISGRSRKVQMEMADAYGITDYASPAGGCLLTDPNISGRVRDLFEHNPDFSMIDVYFLSLGRHYRLNPRTKVIASRNESEEKELLKYREQADYLFLPDFKGPVAYVRGPLERNDIDLIRSLLCHYGRNIADSPSIRIMKGDTPFENVPPADPIAEDILQSIRL